MKYRIQETIDGNGDSTFRVQEKTLWWWKNCGHRGEHSKEFAKFWIKSRQTKAVKYHTVEQ